MNSVKLRINYRTHPGFKDLLDRPAVAAPECEKLFAEIDSVFDECAGTKKRRSAAEIDRIVESEIQPRVNELKRIVHETMNEGDLFRASACTALDRMVVALKKEILFRDAQKSYRARNRSSKVTQIVESLSRDGISLFNISSQKIQEIWSGLGEHREFLEQQRATRPKGVASCVRALPLKGPYWNTLTRELRSLGMIDAVGEYSRYKVDLDYLALHLAHEHEDWYQSCYSDVGVGTQKTTYMHYDQDFQLLKMMIYLRDFDESLGPLAPFSIIKGNLRMSGSYSHSAFYKELDYANGELVSPEDRMGTSYYRPVFKLPKYRKEFIKLPVPLQGASHFGDDVLDGTELSDRLLSAETKMTAQLANCALFNGGHHVHRGGMVANGERWAIQVGFRIRDPSLKEAAKRWRSKIGLHTPDFAKKIYRTVNPRRG